MIKQRLSRIFFAFAVASICTTNLHAANSESGDVSELGKLQSSLKNKRSKEIDARAAYTALDAKLQKALAIASRQAYVDIKGSGIRFEKLTRLYNNRGQTPIIIPIILPPPKSRLRAPQAQR